MSHSDYTPGKSASNSKTGLQENAASYYDPPAMQGANVLGVVVRWILVLPVACVAFFALNIEFALLSLILPSPSDWSKYLTLAINSVLPSYYFVYLGAKVAPSKRVHVGLALCAMLAFGEFLAIKYAAGSQNPIWLVDTLSIVSIILAISAIPRLMAREENPPENEPPGWVRSVFHVLANACGIVYAYGYLGQSWYWGLGPIVMLISAIVTTHNLTPLLSIFLIPGYIISVIFSLQFWLLVVTAAIGYAGLVFSSKMASEPANI